MRTIWFVDSPDAEAFHLYPDCPSLEQAKLPIVTEEVSGLAEVVGTERFGDLHPCGRCRQKIDAEEEAASWERHLDSSAMVQGAIEFLTQGTGLTPAHEEGLEPLRVFQQNFVKLSVFTDRLEIKHPTLLGGGEPNVIPFEDVRGIRPISWIPVIRAPAIEIDSELDGEIYTDKFEMSILDSPEMVAAAIEEVAGAYAPPKPEKSPRGASAKASASARAAGEGREADGPTAAKGTKANYGRGIRGDLARLYDEGRKHGVAFLDDSGRPFSGSGAEFADGVLAGCNDAESLKNLAERLDEAVRLARFFVEANANPLTKPKRWNKLVVSIGGCDMDSEFVPYTPGGADDPFAGGGGRGGGGGAGNGGKRRKKGPPPTFKKKRYEMTPEEQEEADRQVLQYHFPEMQIIAITGDHGPQNCLAFALGGKGRIWGDSEMAISDAKLDQLLASNGWRDDPNGDVIIGVWRSDLGIKHISRQLSEDTKNGHFLHESKFGSGGIQAQHLVTDKSDGFEGNDKYTGAKLTELRRGTIRSR